tara:strand:+ start:565 stop:1290 length:726 start_codon:yes stop_codon:yes gene_type:complete
MKQRAKDLLTNYKIPAGLEFKYLPGEEILVDSFSFVSSSLQCQYIGFITNERFIFKQTEGFGAAEEMKHADMKFINWKDITGIVYGGGIKLAPFLPSLNINFRILGKVVDFSPEGECENFDIGVLKHGSFLGGLSYSNQENLEKDLLPVLKKLSSENNIPFGTSLKYNEFATINQDETEKITQKANSLYLESYKATFYFVLGLIGILAIWGLIAITSFSFVFLLALLLIGGFFGYKKYLKK